MSRRYRNSFVKRVVELDRSRGDDVTLANPLGPPVRGWGQVEEHLEQAASTAREGEPLRYEAFLSTRQGISATTSSLSGPGQSSAVRKR